MFTEKEKQLIIYGKQQGKTQQEVEKALVRLRTGFKPPVKVAEEPTVSMFDHIVNYGKGLADVPENLMNDYSGAWEGIKNSITSGANSMDQGFQEAQRGHPFKGALRTVWGGVQAGVGAAGSSLGAIFAPITETAKALVPKTGIAGVDSAAEGALAGAALAGPAGVIPGAAIGTGFWAVNASQDYLLKNVPEFKKIADENPNFLPTINNALTLALAVYGNKKLGEGQKPDILNTPVSKVPGRVGQNLLDTGGVAVKPIANAASAVGEKVGQAAGGVGGVIKAVGKGIYKDAYTLTADEARFVQRYQINKTFLEHELAKAAGGSKEHADITNQLKTLEEHAPKVASETALERGIMGTEKMIGRQSGVEKMELWKNKIEPALKSSKVQMTKSELFKVAKERVASEVEPTRKAAMQNAYESLLEDYEGFKSADLLTANKIKTSLDKFTPTKIFKGQDVASELKTLKADMATAIRQKTYESLTDVKIKEAYRDYANLKQLEGVGIKALTEAGYKGGFGGFWTSLYNAAVTPIKTVGGQTLYRVGNYLEFVGENGTKTLGQHLETTGLNPRSIIGIPPQDAPGGPGAVLVPKTNAQSPKAPGGVPKTLETVVPKGKPSPLTQEATKYKSAEDRIVGEAIKKHLESNGVKVNSDNTVTLYHATSPENVAKINSEGVIKGGSTATGGMTGLDLKPSAFFGTDAKWTKDTWGSGRKVIEVKVPVESIRQPAQNVKEVYFEGGLKRGDDGIWRPLVKPRSTFYDKLLVKGSKL